MLGIYHTFGSFVLSGMLLEGGIVEGFNKLEMYWYWNLIRFPSVSSGANAKQSEFPIIINNANDDRQSVVVM